MFKLIDPERVIIELYDLLAEIDKLSSIHYDNHEWFHVAAVRESTKRIKYEELYNQLKRDRNDR